MCDQFKAIVAPIQHVTLTVRHFYLNSYNVINCQADEKAKVNKLDYRGDIRDCTIWTFKINPGGNDWWMGAPLISQEIDEI